MERTKKNWSEWQPIGHDLPKWTNYPYARISDGQSLATIDRGNVRLGSILLKKPADVAGAGPRCVVQTLCRLMLPLRAEASGSVSPAF